MRSKGDNTSLAERLNNALAQLHAQKIEHQREKDDLCHELSSAQTEIERLRAKLKQAKRMGGAGIGERIATGGEGEGASCIGKINQYMGRLQETAQQMVQVAEECRMLDGQIGAVAMQLERNVSKSVGGLTKHTQELVRKWSSKEVLRVENQRLEVENKELFQLTTQLQHNFKQTDILIKQYQRAERIELPGRGGQASLRQKVVQLEEENQRLREREGGDSERFNELMSQIETLEQENSTIKTIHQRTMKKLEQMEAQQKSTPSHMYPQSSALQEERGRWMEKNQELYEQIRRLSRQLLISEENEKRVRDELESCLQIYGQWQEERERRGRELLAMREGTETYRGKVEELEGVLHEKEMELGGLREQVDGGEAEKSKIVGVFQLEVQELNDQVFKLTDQLGEYQQVMARESKKYEHLLQQNQEASRKCELLQEDIDNYQEQQQGLNGQISEKQAEIGDLTEQLESVQDQLHSQTISKQEVEHKLKSTIKELQEDKQEMTEVMSELRGEFASAQRQSQKHEERYQQLSLTLTGVTQELKTITNHPATTDPFALLTALRQQHNSQLELGHSLKQRQAHMLLAQEQLQKEHDQAMEALQQEHNSLQAEMQAQQSNAQAQIKIMKMRALETGHWAEEDLGGVKEWAELVTALVDSVTSRSQIMERESEENIQVLKQQLANLKHEAAASGQALQRSQYEALETQASHQLEKKMREEAEGQAEKLKQRMSSLEEQIKLTQETVRKLQSQLGTKSQELEWSRGENEKQAQDLHSLRQQLDNLTEQLSSKEQATKEQDQIYQQLNALMEQNRALSDQQQLHCEQITAQQEQIELVRQQNTTLTQDLNDLLQQYQTTTMQSQLLREQVAQLQEQHKYFDAIQLQLQQRQETEVGSLGQAEEQKMTTDMEMINLSLENDEQANRIEALEEEIVKLKDQLSSYEVSRNRNEPCAIVSQEQLNYHEVNGSGQSIQLRANNLSDAECQTCLLSKQTQVQTCTPALSITNVYAHIHTGQANQLEYTENGYEQEIQTNPVITAEQWAQTSPAKNTQSSPSINEAHSAKILENQQTVLKQEKLQFDQQSQLIQEKEAQFKKHQEGLQLKSDAIKEREQQLLQKQALLIKENQQLLSAKKLLQQQQENFRREEQESLLGLQSLKVSASEQHQTSQLEEELTFARQLLGEKEEGLVVKEQRLCQLEQQVQELTHKLLDAQKINQQLHYNVKELDQQNEQLRAAVSKQRASPSVEESLLIKSENSRLEQRVTELQQQLVLSRSNSPSKSPNKLDISRQTDREEVQKLRAEVEQKRERVQQLEDDLIEKEGIAGQYEQQIYSMRKKIESLQHQVEEQEIKVQVKNKECQSYNRKVDELQSQLLDCGAAETRKSEEIEQLKSEKHRYSQRVSEIEQMVAQLQGEEEKENDIRAELAITAEQRDHLAHQLAELQRQRQSLEQKMTEMKQRTGAELHHAQQCHEEMMGKVNSKQQEMDQMIQEFTSKLQTVNSEKETLQAQLKCYQDIGTTDHILQQLQSIDNLKSQKSSAMATIKEQEQTIQKIKSREQESKKKESEGRLKNQQLENEINRLQAQIKCLKQQLEQSIANHQSEEQMQEKIKQLEQQNEETKEELLDAQNKLSAFKQKHNSLQVKAQELEDELKSKNGELETISSENRQYQEEFKRLTKEKTQLEQRVNSQLQGSRLRQSKASSIDMKKTNHVDSIRPAESKMLQRSRVSEENEEDEPQHRRTSILVRMTRAESTQLSDLPLQISRNRQAPKSSHHPSSGSNSRTITTEPSELQFLKGELQNKTHSIQTLEKQYKSKVEDFSKLQRVVESLNDELSLERRRVSKFQQLYQNIHAKKNKLIGEKSLSDNQ